jgi:hypothetical protein
LPLDNRGPSKEQLPMWERRPSGNLGKFLAIARPRSGVTTLIRVSRPVHGVDRETLSGSTEQLK